MRQKACLRHWSSFMCQLPQSLGEKLSKWKASGSEMINHLPFVLMPREMNCLSIKLFIHGYHYISVINITEGKKGAQYNSLKQKRITGSELGQEKWSTGLLATRIDGIKKKHMLTLSSAWGDKVFVSHNLCIRPHAFALQPTHNENWYQMKHCCSCSCGFPLKLSSVHHDCGPAPLIHAYLFVLPTHTTPKKQNISFFMKSEGMMQLKQYHFN